MAESIFTREWRAGNAGTSYPFAAGASLVNGASRRIPVGTFLDAIIRASGAVGPLYMAEAVVTAATAVLVFRDAERTFVASAEIPLADPPADVALLDEYLRPAGILVSEPGRLAVFRTWGLGTHTFEPDQTELSPSACILLPDNGVRGILLDDGTLLSGYVRILGDRGVVVRRESGSERSGCGVRGVETIRIDIVGDPLFRRRLCSGLETFEPPRPIRLLRFTAGEAAVAATPDGYGNVEILINNADADDTVLRIGGTDTGLVLRVAGGPD